MSQASKPISTVFANTSSYSFSSGTIAPSSNAGGQYFTIALSGTASGSGTVVYTGSTSVSNWTGPVYGTVSHSFYNSAEPAVGRTTISVYQVAALLENGNSVKCRASGISLAFT